MVQPRYYATEQLFAELAFLEYQVKHRCRVDLVAGQGLQKVLTNARKFLDGTDRSKENLKAIHAMITLSSSLKHLWFQGIEFKQQLVSMNTGDYLYGEQSEDQEHYYKDFEYELFTASMVSQSDVRTILPRELDGNDVVCDGIEIQCKHPDALGKNIQRFARKLSSRCKKNGTHGILALAVEDAMEFHHETTTEDDWMEWLQGKLQDGEKTLGEIIPEALQYSPRVLGVILTATYFKDLFGGHFNVQLVRTTNSVFCHKPDDGAITDDVNKKLLQILSVFNPQPNFLTFRGQRIASINTKSVSIELDETEVAD